LHPNDDASTKTGLRQEWFSGLVQLWQQGKEKAAVKCLLVAGDIKMRLKED
jgi:hypothetical protein